MCVVLDTLPLPPSVLLAADVLLLCVSKVRVHSRGGLEKGGYKRKELKRERKQRAFGNDGIHLSVVVAVASIMWSIRHLASQSLAELCALNNFIRETFTDGHQDEGPENVL